VYLQHVACHLKGHASVYSDVVAQCRDASLSCCKGLSLCCTGQRCCRCCAASYHCLPHYSRLSFKGQHSALDLTDALQQITKRSCKNKKQRKCLFQAAVVVLAFVFGLQYQCTCDANSVVAVVTIAYAHTALFSTASAATATEAYNDCGIITAQYQNTTV
jgi:hypothetical protein